MSERIKLKHCQKCQTPVALRYRIQYDDTEKWWLVCPDCWKQVSDNNPNYRYGGTWKAR